jgi:hypothetical protein
MNGIIPDRGHGVLSINWCRVLVFWGGGAAALFGPRPLDQVSRSHSVTPHSVVLLWTRDRPAAETSLLDSTQHSQVSFRLIFKNETIKIYRTVILPVLCGCDTWSLTLREQHWLRMLENRMLGSDADKISGDWKRLHN